MPGEKKLTDYEKYIRTEELLALQKPEAELANPDELLFQVTHQAAELYMKLIEHEVEAVKGMMARGELARAAHHLRRCGGVMTLLASAIQVLETMPPHDYHAFRVRSLGRGSGQESPGFNRLLKLSPTLYPPFAELLRARGLTVQSLHAQRAEHYDLWTLVQGLMEYDEKFILWRLSHIQLVRRIIGLDVMSLKGVPAQQLWEGARESFFPELWNVINVVTREYKTGY
jgi:tryptophan 2,3-dioxygenase